MLEVANEFLCKNEQCFANAIKSIKMFNFKIFILLLFNVATEKEISGFTKKVVNYFLLPKDYVSREVKFITFCSS